MPSLFQFPLFILNVCVCVCVFFSSCKSSSSPTKQIKKAGNWFARLLLIYVTRKRRRKNTKGHGRSRNTGSREVNNNLKGHVTLRRYRGKKEKPDADVKSFSCRLVFKSRQKSICGDFHNQERRWQKKRSTDMSAEQFIYTRDRKRHKLWPDANLPTHHKQR